MIGSTLTLVAPPISHPLMCRYVHVLVQKISLNVDLGFILSLVDFFSAEDEDALLEVRMSLQ